MPQRDYAVASAWRVGLFIVVTVAYPFLLTLVLKSSACAGAGGACGALALVISMIVKPLIFIAFVVSMIAISVCRARDIGLPGFAALIIAALMLSDWQFGVTFGAPWSVGFVLGAMGALPAYLLSALALIVFLSSVRSDESDSSGPAKRFGIVGRIALGLTLFVLLAGALRIVTLQAIFHAGGSVARLGLLSYSFVILRWVPWVVLGLAAALGVLVWQDYFGRGEASTPGSGSGPVRPVLPTRSNSAQTFGKRGH